MTMDTETLMLLNAYHDGELSPGEALSMQRRIEREPELAGLARRLADLSSGLASILPGESAPERLRGAILSSISADLKNEQNLYGDMAQSASRIELPSARAPWRSIAAALIIGFVGGGFGGGYLTHVTQGETRLASVESEIVSAHLRGLIAPQPFDIASSEGHVVKPWFNGKTTIAPTTPNFAAQGFPLIGGRVDVIDREPIPVMVYKRRQHTISVSVTASNMSGTPAQNVIDGTNVTTWTDGNLTYWAISDLNLSELISFADLFRKQLSGAG